MFRPEAQNAEQHRLFTSYVSASRRVKYLQDRKDAKVQEFRSWRHVLADLFSKTAVNLADQSQLPDHYSVSTTDAPVPIKEAEISQARKIEAATTEVTDLDQQPPLDQVSRPEPIQNRNPSLEDDVGMQLVDKSVSWLVDESQEQAGVRPAGEIIDPFLPEARKRLMLIRRRSKQRMFEAELERDNYRRRYDDDLLQYQIQRRYGETSDSLSTSELNHQKGRCCAGPRDGARRRQLLLRCAVCTDCWRTRLQNPVLEVSGYC